MHVQTSIRNGAEFESTRPQRKEPDSRNHSIRVFYSYSHRDERLRDQLETHLSALKRQDLIDEWHDRRITAGDEWRGQIDEHLEDADLILLLISPDFLASDYCYEKEMSRALEKHETKQARVIPVIVRPVDWDESPIRSLQALPTDARPVTAWSNRDAAWVDVVKGIRKAIRALSL